MNRLPSEARFSIEEGLGPAHAGPDSELDLDAELDPDADPDSETDRAFDSELDRDDD